MLITHLEKRLERPLPGIEAQNIMAHAIRQRILVTPSDAKAAGVMVLLFPDDTKSWKMVLIKRAAHQKDRHAGQIGFPGGKMELYDEDLRATALRELSEEVGIHAGDVRILGQLTELFIPVSNFLVQPFIGFLPYVPEFIPEISEVQEVICPSVRSLMPFGARKVMDLQVNQNITLKKVPFFDYNSHVIWGATAMILSEFLALLDGFEISGN